MNNESNFAQLLSTIQTFQ